MEYHLEPLYEAFERLNKAKEDGNQASCSIFVVQF